jgi:hypothetical protein
MNWKAILNGVIAVLAFSLVIYVFARWFRLLIIRYHLTESSIRITIFGLPMFRIPYRHIQSCELVKASELWKPWRSLLFRALWLHTRLFVDGTVVQSRWIRYVLTPENPEEFTKLVGERQQVSRKN